MDKQRPVSKVAHNDEYSATLMEMYTRWMDGNCFQNSTVNEAFEGMDPQSHGAEIEDTTKKKKAAKKEKSVAEGLMADELVGTTYEVVMEDGEVIIIEKMDGVDDNGSKTCWKGYRKAGTKMKGGKEVNNCVKAGYEMDGEQELDEKNGLYANIHAKRKRGESPAKPGHEDYPAKDAFKKAAKTAKKEEYDVDTANQLWSEISERLEKLGEMDNVKFKVIGEKLDPVGKEDGDIDNDGDKDKSDSYLHARRKKIGKILAMKGKK